MALKKYYVEILMEEDEAPVSEQEWEDRMDLGFIGVEGVVRVSSEEYDSHAPKNDERSLLERVERLEAKVSRLQGVYPDDYPDD